MRRIHSFEASATNLRKIISARAARLDGRSVDLTMDMLDNEIQLMRRVIAVEEVGTLEGFEIRSGSWPKYCEAEARSRQDPGVLDSSPLKVAAEHYAGIPDGRGREGIRRA